MINLGTFTTRIWIHVADTSYGTYVGRQKNP